MLRKLWLYSGFLALYSLPVFPQSSSANQQQIQLHLKQAQDYLKTNRPRLAIDEFNAVLALDSRNVDALANVGVLEFFQGEYKEAAERLDGALKLQPGLWKIQALLGMSEKRVGETSKAQSDMQDAFPHMQEEKLKLQMGMELIEIDYVLSDLGNAAEVVNVLRHMKPADADVLYTAHRIYSDLADETTLSLAMVAPDSARMHQLMAHELARQAKDQAAIAQLREAIKLEPHRSDPHFELAEILNLHSARSAPGEAEKEYKAALSENPFDEKSECRLGDIASRGPDLGGAVAHYTRALEIQPNDPEASLGLAKVLMAGGQLTNAEPYLKHALKLEPFDPTGHYRLGVLYQRLGRKDDARLEFAEYEKLKRMKSRLQDIYTGMQLQPKESTQDEPVPLSGLNN